MPSDDPELLRRYAEEKSEAAFAELVGRHVDLVYAVALRRLNGDAHLAQEVTQGVFTDLARKAATLVRHPSLGAWLFRSARFAAAQAMRTEHRRMKRETEAHMMHEDSNSSAAEPDWSRLRPVVDEVLDALPERDRVAVWLRFYEGKPFAEIGAQLSASEDAVRVRVDRALEKMRSSLAARGVISTAAALSSALAREAGILAPAGLAASVTGSALTSAALGGGAAGAVWLSTFMSTTKIGLWGVAAVLLASLVGNAYLFTHPPVRDPSAVTPLKPERVLAATRPRSLGELAKGDPTELRDRLRTDRASETTVRGVVEGVLRRRYRETLIARRAENMKHAWWQAAPRMASDSISLADDPVLLRTMVLDALEQLFGPDPAEIAEKDARFGFLPMEARQKFIALERDYETALARIPGADKNPALAAGLKRDRDEKEAQLLAGLPPAERVEYDLHFSSTAVALRERMSQITATEEEYRATMAVLQAAGVARARSPGDASYPEKEQQAIDQLVATLGYDRALDYVWAGASEYPTYARLAREAGLPPSIPGRVLQLASDTYDRAVEIHRDATLSVPEKRAGLLALQQAVKPQLDALLPPAQQQQVGEFGQDSLLAWFTLLGDGRYRSIATTAAGNTGSIMQIGSASVETPLSPNVIRRRLVVRPPALRGN